MKKILIVNNNMQIGGVQKSLYNLLWAVHDQAEITLLLFANSGEYADKLPKSVRVIDCNSLFRYLGISQGACKGFDKLKRGALAGFCRMFGRHQVMKLLLASQERLAEHYDVAVSFLHNGNYKNFYGGVQDFVLERVNADRKVAFLHCDYSSCGANTPANNQLIRRFDVVAACSEGCREAFLNVLPDMEYRCVTVKNCHRFDEILGLAEERKISYPEDAWNVVMVSRLAHEKGIERALEAVAYAKQKGIAMRLHIVGGGPMESFLSEEVSRLELTDCVHFYGEQNNPYPYMRAADLFFMTSFHEAAPMVIEEARTLGLPVLTVRTTSSEEMVTRNGCGWVCENEQQAINEMLVHVLSHEAELAYVKSALTRQMPDNATAITQFLKVVEG